MNSKTKREVDSADDLAAIFSRITLVSRGNDSARRDLESQKQLFNRTRQYLLRCVTNGEHGAGGWPIDKGGVVRCVDYMRKLREGIVSVGKADAAFVEEVYEMSIVAAIFADAHGELHKAICHLVDVLGSKNDIILAIYVLFWTASDRSSSKSSQRVSIRPIANVMRRFKLEERGPLLTLALQLARSLRLMDWAVRSTACGRIKQALSDLEDDSVEIKVKAQCLRIMMERAVQSVHHPVLRFHQAAYLKCPLKVLMRRLDMIDVHEASEFIQKSLSELAAAAGGNKAYQAVSPAGDVILRPPRV
ncbi:hypothetical protein GQ42DRAFT_160838 [Ramicandelaber brevisporus]|nr:hypothetical protein GQ42DRAFT_160838 [Ramicandelaber brevisporus]